VGVRGGAQALKEAFYRPPRVGEEKLESAMSDLANIVFVYIEVLLRQQALELRTLFDQYDADGSGAMDHEEFTTFMHTLPLNLRWVGEASRALV
jgi:hypothetical protein